MNQFQAQQTSPHFLEGDTVGYNQSTMVQQLQNRQQRLWQPPATPSRQNTQQSFMIQPGRQAAPTSVQLSALPVHPALASSQLGLMHKQPAQAISSSPAQKTQQMQQQQQMQEQQQQGQKMQAKRAQKAAVLQAGTEVESDAQQSAQKPAHTESMMEQQAEETELDSYMDAEVLKMKLQRGSEKLLQWSVQQEHALTDMKKKLDESLEVRDRLKKNMLEMQMQLEHNSQKYHGEKKAQETLMEKVQHTRSVYSILHEHFQKVNESLENCYKVKDELVQNQQALKEYIDSLRQPLERAEILYHKRIKAMEELVETHQEIYKTGLEKANAASHDLEQKLQEAKHLISLKNDRCLELENQLALSSKSVIDIISEKDKTILQLQQEVANSLNVMKEKDTVIKNKDLKFENMISQLRNLEQELNNVKLSYKKACLENSMLQTNLEFHKTEAEKLAGQRNLLVNQLEDSKIYLQKLESENHAMNVKLQEYSSAQKLIENELANWKQQLLEKSTEMECLQSKYQTETEDLRAAVALHKENYDRVTAELHEAEVMDTEIQGILRDKDKKITDLTAQLQSLGTQLTEKADKVLELTAEENALLARISAAESLLAKEAEHKENLFKELTAVNSDKQKLEEQVSKLKLDAESKCSIIENEWKEKMSSEIQQVMKEMENGQEILKAQFSQSLKFEEEKYAKLLAEADLDTQNKIDELKKDNNEIVEIKAKLENSLREKDEMYKMVLEQKNRLETEIHEKEELVSKLQESLNSSEKDREEIVSKLTNKIEEVEAKRINDVKDMLKEVDENYLKHKNDISKNLEKITLLEKNLKVKDNIINDLNKKLKNTESILKEVTSRKENVNDVPRAANILKANNASQDTVQIPHFESPLHALNSGLPTWKKVTFDVTDDSDVSSIDMPIPRDKKEDSGRTRTPATETSKMALIFGKPKKKEEVRDPLNIFEKPQGKKTSLWTLTTSGKRKSQAEETPPSQQSRSKTRDKKFFKGRENKKPDEGGTIDFGCLNFDDL